MSSEVLVKKRGRPKKVVEPETIVVLSPVVPDLVVTDRKKAKTKRSTTVSRIVKDEPTIIKTSIRSPKVVVEAIMIGKPKTRTKRSAKSIDNGLQPQQDATVSAPPPATRSIESKSARRTQNVQQSLSPEIIQESIPERHLETIVIDTEHLQVKQDNQQASSLLDLKQGPSLATETRKGASSTSLPQDPIARVKSEQDPLPLTATTTVIARTDQTSPLETIESLHSTLFIGSKNIGLIQLQIQELMREQAYRRELSSYHKQADLLEQEISLSANSIKNISLRQAASNFAELAAPRPVIDSQPPITKVNQSKANTMKYTLSNPTNTTTEPKTILSQLQSQLQTQQVAPFTTSSITSNPTSNSSDKMPQRKPPSSPPPSPSASPRLPQTHRTTRPQPPPTPPLRPTQQSLSELKKNPEFKRLSYSWTGLIVGIPVLVATSWWLWKGHQQRQMERRLGLEPGINTNRGLGNGGV